MNYDRFRTYDFMSLASKISNRNQSFWLLQIPLAGHENSQDLRMRSSESWNSLHTLREATAANYYEWECLNFYLLVFYDGRNSIKHWVYWSLSILPLLPMFTGCLIYCFPKPLHRNLPTWDRSSLQWSLLLRHYFMSFVGEAYFAGAWLTYKTAMINWNCCY